jgi:CRISPR-associated exonuclease Cas4
MSNLGLVLLFVGAVLFLLTARRSHAAGLPAGRIISADMAGLEPAQAPIFDRELGLRGRPDYLLRKGRDLVPVEVKSGKPPRNPYDSHILQLGAYLMLAWSKNGRRPPFGILAYQGSSFRIPFTISLEKELRSTLNRMRDGSQEFNRSHRSPARCTGCGYRDICDQALSNPGGAIGLRL